MPRKVEISHKTIIFTVVFLTSLWFLYFIKDILLELFVALLVVSILDPFVTRLTSFKIPRGFSILITYLLFLGLFGIAIYSLLPPLISQTTSFANNLPKYLEQVPTGFIVNEQVINQLLSQIGSLPGQVLKVGVSIFSNALGVLTVLIFAFYLLLARNKLNNQLDILFGEKKSKLIAALIDVIESKLGSWARGQFTLMLLVGSLTYLGLVVLRLPYALPLAILAGLLEIIPYIGPIIAAIPSILIGLGISPLTGLAAGLLSLSIQQLENYVFVPKIMEKSAGVSPIITLLALSIGFRLAGILGAIIAIPVFIIIQTLLNRYFSKNN